MRALPLLLLLTACDGGDPKDDTADTADSGETDTQGDGVTPTILSVDRVECSDQQSAGETWSFSLSVDDPQGADSVDGGTVEVVSSADQVIADYAFPCNNEGVCEGSFRAAYDGVTCAMSGTMTFRFTVTDVDGNPSAATDYATP